ncbi:MAG: diacylglycerol kinase [Gammaproteobacteria bacterium]|jgi:diacylglycerol kinase (ATP)
MANHNQDGIARIWRALLFSLAGIRTTWKHEAAFRLEVWLCLVMIPSALWVGTGAVERALLIGSCLVVLITELLNSAIESAVDRIGEDRHALSARAKDMGSAAVFVSLCLAGITWALIGYERFFA